MHRCRVNIEDLRSCSTSDRDLSVVSPSYFNNRYAIVNYDPLVNIHHGVSKSPLPSELIREQHLALYIITAYGT